MRSARRGQLERRPSASGVPLSRGGASRASEHGIAACHLRGELEQPAHGLPFTDWLGTHIFQVKKFGYFIHNSIIRICKFIMACHHSHFAILHRNIAEYL